LNLTLIDKTDIFLLHYINNLHYILLTSWCEFRRSGVHLCSGPPVWKVLRTHSMWISSERVWRWCALHRLAHSKQVNVSGSSLLIFSFHSIAKYFNIWTVCKFVWIWKCPTLFFEHWLICFWTLVDLICICILFPSI